MAVEFRIGLPAVDDPWLNLQFVGREPLNSQPVEEPGGVRRNIRRLVCPIVEVVVAEQADVGDEDAGINIEAVIYVEMISAPGFRHILIGILKIPLADAA